MNCCGTMPLLDHDVRVGASRAKRGEAGNARRMSPLRELLLHEEWRAFKINMRVAGAGMERGRELPVLHLQQNLGQPRDAGRGLAVADVRLDRPDGTEAAFGATAAEGFGEAVDLDRVA